MKRLFIALLAVLTLSSCEKIFDTTVVQQDLVGTWDFYIPQPFMAGDITITKTGECSVRYDDFVGDGHTFTESGTFNITGGKVTLNIPSWPSGTFKIEESKKVKNRYLIAPHDGVAKVVIQHDMILEDLISGPAPW